MTFQVGEQEIHTKLYETTSRGFSAICHPCPKDPNSLMIQFVPKSETIGVAIPTIVEKHLKHLLPAGTKVSFVGPQPEWKIKMVSMKALGVFAHWAFDLQQIQNALPDLLEELSTACRGKLR